MELEPYRPPCEFNVLDYFTEPDNLSQWLDNLLGIEQVE